MTINLSNIRSISGIKKANKEAGYHFFDEGALRFFNSRIDQKVYNGPGGIYFVTSEEFVDSNWKSYGRFYTVRQFVTEGEFRGSINTIGEFNRMTKYAANARAKELAEGEE